MAEVRAGHRRLAATLRMGGALSRRSLVLGWLLVQALALAGSGCVALGLLVMWGLGLQRRLSHELPWGGYEFGLLSVLLWGLAAGYVVALRVWWPHARRVLRGGRPATLRGLGE